MNDYSKILVKVIFTLLENISALFLLFYFIWPDFVSFRFVSQNSISRRRQMIRQCRKSSTLLRWLEAGNCTDFSRARGWHGRWGTFGSGRNSAKFWRRSTRTVLEVARLVSFLCLWRSISAKWGINCPKTPQNYSRQHRETKLSELYLSDCH